MLNVVRCSQVQGLIALDGSTISYLGEIENVWLDNTGRVAYLSGNTGYLPLEQVANISNQAVSTYGHLIIDTPDHLQHLERIEVQSSGGDPLGWVEDFLFDWHTGEIAAYILAGQIAEPFGEPVTLYPEDVQQIAIEYLIIRDCAAEHLQPISEGLKGFLSEKSHQVQHLVKVIGDQLHDLVSPDDQPEVVHVKVKEVSDEIATTGDHDHNALQEATEFLHNQWENLQQNISRSSQRAQSALNSAWKNLITKP
jgi:sporulation protein YlmC with PRC-barrel domain